MEEGKRIRLVFRDDDILSDAQKFEGLSRSWVLLKPHQHHFISDLASHLLHAFQLHQSCPHGLLLSICGFVLPPFESIHILNENEIISVRKRKDILSIEGNDAVNDVRKLKALGKHPLDSGGLFLTTEEFEKEKGGYESDEPEEESEDGDEGLLVIVENSLGENGNANKRNHKRKAMERLECYTEKKQHSRAEHGGNTSSDVCKEKKVGSIAGDNVENRDEPTKHNDTNDVFGDGVKRKKKKRSEDKHGGNSSSDVSKEKKDGSMHGDYAEISDEPANDSDNYTASGDGVKGTVDVQERDRETVDTKVALAGTTKVPSRNARRKKAKRIWLRDMAKIRKQNASGESEGLRNWKEDQAKADRKRLDDQWKGQQKWKYNQADGERNKADDQPKGLLHWKLSSQNNGLVKGKRRKQYNQNDEFLELPNQNGYMHKQQHKKGQSSEASQEPISQNCDASTKSNHNSAEENEVLPIVVRPGHIRFEPLEKDEQAVQQDHAPLETFNWNGITNKKKGQQWGKENCRFTPRNNYKTNEEDSETQTKEKEAQPNEGVDFDKLPPLPGFPKKGDLIAYQVLELSSTWTPELSAYRVGKVSWHNTESNQTLLLPVPEYPIFPEKDDEDEAIQPDNSLYKENGSLEIDFPSLIDVRILTNGRSEPGNDDKHMFEAFTGNLNALKTALPGSCDKPTAEPSSDTLEANQGKAMKPSTAEETSGSIWDQLSEALNAKKEQLAKQNDWSSTPKKVVVSEKLQHASPGTNWGKKAQNGLGKQVGSRSLPYKALRGSALGPTMAVLRSQKDT